MNIRNCSPVVSIFIAMGISVASAVGGWTEVVVGSGHKKIAIGQGRNDGITRVYSVGYWSGLEEYTWTGGVWNKVEIDGGVDGSAPQLGSARTDGITRLYCDGFEYTYASSSWNFSKQFGASKSDLRLIQGRNDGIVRLYVAGSIGFIHEYTWVSASTSYTDLAMPSAPSSINRMAFGAARNDGINRLYGVTSAGELCEWSYSGGWTIASTNFGLGPLLDIAIDNPRGDGLNRIYVTCSDGLVYEVSRNGATWVSVAIGFGTQEMNSVAIGVTRSDGIKRVLVGNQYGRIYELTFRNGNWIQDLVVQSEGAAEGVTIGAGRGDGVNRIYAAKDGSLFEYTYTPTTSAPFAAQLLPNGILEWSTVPGGVYDVEWSSDLDTWHSDWSSLTGVPSTGASVQKTIPRFFRVKKRTE